MNKNKKRTNKNSTVSNSKFLKTDQVTINENYIESKFITEFCKAVSEKVDTKFKNGAQFYGKPFSCSVLPNFLNSTQYVETLKQELTKVELCSKNSDLFQFKQSNDLASSSVPAIKKLINILYKDCLPWLEKLTGFLLTNEVDMTCSKYDYTDVLLCHDDMLRGRRIAFIYYLVPEWEKSDGGTLDLFEMEDGNAGSIIHSLIPTSNCFVFFEVSPASFHQVSEVLKNKSRLSINGWFHSDSYEKKLDSKMEDLILSVPQPLDSDDIIHWLNPIYLKPESVMQIRENFSESSEIELPNFLREEKYKLVANALKFEAINWKVIGPRNKRFFRQGINLPDIIEKCQNIMNSEEMCLILSNLTGLPLHPSAEVDSSSGSSDDEDSNCTGKLKNTNPLIAKYVSLIRKWSPYCYTLLHDNLMQGRNQLDTVLYFNCDDWDSKFGGFTSYVAKGETDELLRIEPKSNSLALIYTEEGTASFVKYINSQALSEPNSGVYYDIFTTFYEQ